MTRIILWALSRIRSCAIPNIAAPVWEHYQAMLEISQATARAHIQGDWESVVLAAPMPTRHAVFQNNWDCLQDLARSGHTQVLWLDLDTVVMRPWDPWNQPRDQMLMYNLTPSQDPVPWPQYLNSGVRWYGDQIPDRVWESAAAARLNWRYDDYAHEQKMHNQMYWSQWTTATEAPQLRPELNWHMPEWQAPEQIPYWERQNGRAWNQVRICHYHATRGTGQALATAQWLRAQSVVNSGAGCQVQWDQEQALRPWYERLVTWLTYQLPGSVIQARAGAGELQAALARQGTRAQGWSTLDPQPRPDLVRPGSLAQCESQAPVVIDLEPQPQDLPDLARVCEPGGHLVIWNPDQAWTQSLGAQGWQLDPDRTGYVRAWLAASPIHQVREHQACECWQRPRT